MSFSFEALTGSLGIDPSDWLEGLNKGGDALAKFEATTAAQFAKIAANGDISFDDAVTAAEQLSESLGIELSDAANQLAAALEDPRAGLESLTAAGVEFTAGERDTIQSLLQSNDTLGAKQAILQSLESQYQAAADSASDYALAAEQAASVDPAGGASAGGPGGGGSDDGGGGTTIIAGLGKYAKLAGLAALAAKATSDFADAEEQLTRLEAILNATGNAAGYSSGQIQVMAQDLAQATTFDDDEFIKAAANIAKFTNISGENFKQTMESAADLAVVLGTDVPSAAQMLGRALDNPGEGLEALQRAGIRLTDAQKQQVEKFMEVNDVASAQAVILDAVKSKSEGAAEALKDTFAGALMDMKNTVSNAFEDVGESLAGLAQDLKIFDIFKFTIDALAFGISSIALGLQSVVALFSGDFTRLEEIANRLHAKWLDIRASWNEFTGDEQEAAELRDRAQSYTQIADLLKNDRLAAANAGQAPATPPAQAPAAQAPQATGQPAATGTAAGGASTRAPAAPLTPAQRAAQYIRDQREAEAERLREREKINILAMQGIMVEIPDSLKSQAELAADKAATEATKAAEIAAHKAAERQSRMATPIQPQFISLAMIDQLGEATRDESLDMFKDLGDDIRKALEPPEGEAIDIANLNVLFDNYKKLMQHMPSFSAAAFEEIRKQVIDNAREVDGALGQMQTMHMNRALAGLQRGGEVFKQREQAKPAPERTIARGGLDYAGLQDTDKGMIQDVMRARRDELRKEIKDKDHWYTAEQRAGLVKLTGDYTAAMVNVRNSTGDARAANLEEVKRIEEAWAFAQEQIKAGSKKTTEELIAEFKKQGDAGKGAADAAIPVANQKNSFDHIADMGKQMSAVFGGAASLAMNSWGGFNDVWENTTDPLEKNAMLLAKANAELQAATINASLYGNGLEHIYNLQRDITNLTRTMQEAKMAEAKEQKEATERAEQAFKADRAKRANLEAERADAQQLGSQGVVSSGVGAAINLNFNGVTDPRQQADMFLAELGRRGFDRSGKRNFFDRT